MRWLLIVLGFLEPPCPHLWEQVQKINVYAGVGKSPDALPTSHTYILRCKACGDMKHHKVSF